MSSWWRVIWTAGAGGGDGDVGLDILVVLDLTVVVDLVAVVDLVVVTVLVSSLLLPFAKTSSIQGNTWRMQSEGVLKEKDSNVKSLPPCEKHMYNILVSWWTEILHWPHPEVRIGVHHCLSREYSDLHCLLALFFLWHSQHRTGRIPNLQEDISSMWNFFDHCCSSHSKLHWACWNILLMTMKQTITYTVTWCLDWPL